MRKILNLPNSDPMVKFLMHVVREYCHKQNKKVGGEGAPLPYPRALSPVTRFTLAVFDPELRVHIKTFQYVHDPIRYVKTFYGFQQLLLVNLMKGFYIYIYLCIHMCTGF